MNSPQGDKEIQPADVVLRRRMVLLAGAGILVAAALAWGLQRLPSQIAGDTDKAMQVMTLLLIGLYIAAVLVEIACVRLWRLGAKARVAEVFPPPGVRVLHDTPVLRGDKARAKGRTLQWMALILGVLVAIPPVMTWWLVRQLMVTA